MNSPGPGFPAMDRERWRLVSAILDRALDLDPADLPSYLEEACAGDAALRGAVEELLAADRRAAGFLETPALELAPELWEGDPDDAPEPGPAGERIGPWRVLKEIGRGGMGAVYLAERADGQFEQTVALKLLGRGLETDADRERFRQERQILARLEHSGIARVVDGGTAPDGRPYVAMEFVQGEPIDRYCRSHRLGLRGVLRLIVQVCRAVEYAHRNLVVHRDLKPGNILVTGDGEVKLLDFGIARVLGADEPPGSPEEAGARLTPLYAAPEQIRGEPPTTATDVYALGILLFTLIAGSHPFRGEGDSPSRLRRRILEESPEPPSAVAGRVPGNRPSRGNRIPPDLDAVALTAVAKDPNSRYGSVTALREDLERWLAGLPVVAARPTLRYRGGKFVRRNRVLIGGAALLVVALLAGLGGTMWQARAARRQRDRALLEARKAGEIKDFTVGLFRVSLPEESLGADVTARDLLARGDRRLERELRNEPVVRAEMLGVLANIYRALGEYDHAESLAVRSVATARGALPRSADQLATGLHWLGIVRRDKADYPGAHAALKEALSLRRGEGKDRRRLYAETLGELASVYRAEDRLDSAEALYREAMAIDEDVLGPQSAEVATDLDNLGVLFGNEERYPEAETAYRRSIAIRDRVLGRRHPVTANSLANLGFALQKLDRYAEAESCMAEALSIRLETLGPDHIDLAHSYGTYANLKLATGDFAGAVPLFERALAIEKRALGPAHPDYSREVNNFATLQYQRGRYEEAARYFREALASRRLSFPADDRGCLSMEHNVGCAYRALGRYDEAERILRDVRTRRRKTLGAGHLDVSASDLHLGILLGLTGRAREGEIRLREAVAVRDSLLGGDHPLTAQAELALADLLRNGGRYAEAETLYRRAMATNESVFPEPSPQSADGFVGMGRLELAAGRKDEARDWLERGLRVRRGAYDPDDPRTAEAGVALGVCVSGREPARADSLLRAYLPALRARPGPPDPLVRRGEAALRRERGSAE